MRKAKRVWYGIVVAAVMHVVTNAMAADGLRASSDWQRWQGRLILGTQPSSFRNESRTFNGESPVLKVESLSLLGDYFLSRPFGLTASGGLRATSGMLLGSRLSLASAIPGSSQRLGFNRWAALASPLNDGSDTTTTAPYLGVGYTGLSAKGNWGISADLGLMALNPGSAVRLGRVFNGSQSLDDTLRELRFSPILQLGVSYSF
jgi:hypothetical protein